MRTSNANALHQQVANIHMKIGQLRNDVTQTRDRRGHDVKEKRETMMYIVSLERGLNPETLTHLDHF
jgi:hypothetical protein